MSLFLIQSAVLTRHGGEREPITLLISRGSSQKPPERPDPPPYCGCGGGGSGRSGGSTTLCFVDAGCHRAHRATVVNDVGTSNFCLAGWRRKWTLIDGGSGEKAGMRPPSRF